MSQLNRNASYLYAVDGLTVWERLRVIRNFLEDRNQALTLSELELLKNELEMSGLDKDSYEYKKAYIFIPQSKKLIEECKNEIAFLEDLEQRLSLEAEKTRIEGKSDNEMYEINYYEELIQKQLLDVKAEMLSVGHITPNTMKNLLMNPSTLSRAVSLGLMSQEAIPLINTLSVSCLMLSNGETDETNSR